MEWTDRLPTEPGWYWWRDTNMPERVVHVTDDWEGILFAWKPNGSGDTVSRTGGEWCGPLIPPITTEQEVIQRLEHFTEVLESGDPLSHHFHVTGVSPYIPEGYYFRDDLDGGRLIKKPANIIWITSPADHTPHVDCSLCSKTFTENDEAIATLHISLGNVTLCRPCYCKCGNDVR